MSSKVFYHKLFFFGCPYCWNAPSYCDIKQCLHSSFLLFLKIFFFVLGQDNYSGSSSPQQLSEDCRFQYVLAAATSTATKINEDTLTYLNQGQSYEIKLKKLGDLSAYRGKMLRVRVNFFFKSITQWWKQTRFEEWVKLLNSFFGSF